MVDLERSPSSPLTDPSLPSSSASKPHSSAQPTSSPDHISPTAHHVDDNYSLYKAARDEPLDPIEAKRVLRKIDRRVIPILFGTYLLQYLDKNSLNFASVYGLQEGTGLVGQDYSWLGRLGIFYAVGQGGERILGNGLE